MKRARRLRLCTSPRLSPTTFVRSISITISLTLLLASLALSPLQRVSGRRLNAGANSQGQQSRGQERRVTPLPPRASAPTANLPNLDELRITAEATRNQSARVKAARPIPSTMRSRRKEFQLLPGTRMSSPRANNGSYESMRDSARRDSRIGLDQTGRPDQPALRSHHARSLATVQSGGPTENVVWTNVVGATASGNTLTKTAATAWGNAGGASTRSIVSGDGYVEFSVTSLLTGMVALSHTDANQDYTSMQFALLPNSDGNLYVFESGLNRGVVSTYSTADRFRVALEGGVVKYRKNGTLVYSSTVAPTYPLLVDAGLYHNGGTQSNVVISGNLSGGTTENVVWTNVVGATASGNTLTKTAGTAWGNAGAASTRSIVSGDGYVEFSVTSLLTGMVALSHTDANQDYTSMQFALLPNSDGNLYVFESGLNRGVVSTYSTADRFRVALEGGVVKYRKNGTLVYTSAVAPTYPLLVDAGLYHNGGTQSNVVISGNLVGGSGGAASEFALARLDPLNRTGTGGEDLLSNNFNWSLPLISLPGRGLDLGLALSYNSLVWTRSGNYLDFDLDQGSIAPGFRIGFPVIEGPYSNGQTNANFYLLVTPAGTRVELRQVGTSIVYESKDSSYLQLTDNLDGTMTLRPTGGSRMNYIVVAGGLRCSKITDRNGNFITATYKSWGELETVTDTLGRVLTFSYDGNANLQSITQTWGSQTHEWATFGWGTATIGNNFPGLSNLGPNSTSIPVLTQVGLPDGSRHNFEYNNSYAMVSRIRYHASDDHLRRYTTYVAPGSATDCPRLTERRDWAEQWTGVNGVPAEVVTSYTHDADTGCRMTLPDGTVHKEYYGSSWQGGLITETRSYATVGDANSNLWQKKTTTTWTQDNPSGGYLTNPRVTETNVYDVNGNRRRATIDYSVAAYAQFGLPYFVTEYAADGTTEIRRTYTDYNLNQAYLDRRIIGLVSAMHLTDAGGFQAKVTYGYDDPARLSSQANTATMHDQTYHGSFTVRGNVTSISRWDATNMNTIVDPAKALTSYMNYNAAGSVIATTDPAGHANQVSYTDSFSTNGVNLDDPRPFSTFAYPTTVTDADGFSSALRYHYDFGSKTRIEGPPPQNQPNGLIQTFTYDSAARLERVTTVNTGAYTRYVYGPYYVQSFWTVNAVADDAYSCQLLDGHGRAYAASGNHPNSTGWYRGQLMSYDIMGRMRQQTNWTEIDHAWAPIGDDATGWQWNNPTEYDWQGRPLKTYNMDGTYQTAEYSGCGCAGGEVATLTDEVNRQQKVYSDVLGRQWKTEILNWDGSVYSTTTNSLNARDQVTLTRQWAGAENGGGAYQDTTMTFDGYGRLQSTHAPQQNAGTATVYTYNADDTIQSVTDARGAIATYGHNNRHLITSINYYAPAGITATPNITFAYDAAGNRTSMTDGTGSLTFQFDQLSRVSSETRTFTGLPGQSFAIGYGYNVAGQLTSLTEPTEFGASVGYSRDPAGRLTSVNGSGFAGGVSQFASNMKYRASNATKEMDYGNGLRLNNSFNSRLQITSYQVKVPGTPENQGERARSEYLYNADGRVYRSIDRTDERFNRSNMIDHVGRLINATSDSAAYYQNFTYDAFSNMTVRGNGSWQYHDTTLMQYSNNRNVSTTVYPNGGQPQTSNWVYDAQGNATNDHNKQYSYDAAGNKRLVFESSGSRYLWLHQDYDADGQRVKRVEQTQIGGPVTTVTSYYLHSSILDRVIIELDQNGQKRQSYVHANGMTIAQQTSNQVQWIHVDPVTGSLRETDTAGNAGSRSEFDPLGNDALLADPAPPEGPSPDYLFTGTYASSGNPYDSSSGCTVDGQPTDCSFASRLVSLGIGDVCPDNRCGPRSVTDEEGNHAGFATFLGSGWLVGNGEGNEDGSSGFIFFDDVQHGTALDAYAMHIQNPRKKRKRGQRRRPSLGSAEGALLGKPLNITIGAGFDPNEAAQIRAALQKNLSDPCAKAMRNARPENPLKTPLEVVEQGGLVIRPANDLFKFSAAELGLVSDATRHAYASEFSSLRAQEGAIPAVRGGVKLTTDGRSQMYLHARAFLGPSFWDSRFSLQDVMSHSFIHLGGQGPTPGWLGPLTHDLKGFKPHDAILKGCRE